MVVLINTVSPLLISDHFCFNKFVGVRVKFKTNIRLNPCILNKFSPTGKTVYFISNICFDYYILRFYAPFEIIQREVRNIFSFIDIL